MQLIPSNLGSNIYDLIPAGTLIEKLLLTSAKNDAKNDFNTRVVWMYRLITPRLFHSKDPIVLKYVFHQIVYNGNFV